MAKKKSESTFDRLMKNDKRRKLFEEKYARFAMWETVRQLMEEAKISVRELAKAMGVSPTVVQDLRSGKRKNITLKNLLGLVSAVGGELHIKSGGRDFSLLD